MLNGMVRTHTDAHSKLILDDGLGPLLIATWIGPATLELVHHLHSWLDEEIASAQRRGTKLLLVNDGTYAGRPSAEVRRAFTERMTGFETIVQTIAVIDNPLVRGAMTAIRWVTGDSFDVLSCKTMPEAMAAARTSAAKHGIEIPHEGTLDGHLRASRTA